MHDTRPQFAANLVLLNDIIAQTPLAAHYWLWGGVLLGCVREGQLLAHDSADADFGYFREDRDRLLAAVTPLVAAGFLPYSRWFSNDGAIVRHTFCMDDAYFDFFEIERHGAVGYYWLHLPLTIKGAWVETTGAIPIASPTEIDFLGRTWRLPDAPEKVLTALYGDWRTPKPEYNHITDEKSLFRKVLWTGKTAPVQLVPPGQLVFTAHADAEAQRKS